MTSDEEKPEPISPVFLQYFEDTDSIDQNRIIAEYLAITCDVTAGLLGMAQNWRE